MWSVLLGAFVYECLRALENMYCARIQAERGDFWRRIAVIYDPARHSTTWMTVV